MHHDSGTGPKRWNPFRKPGAPSSSWALWILGALVTVGLLLPVAQTLAQRAGGDPLSDSPYLRIDPEKIEHDEDDPPSACGGCHSLEYAVWEETPHATGFDELHRRKNPDGTRPAQTILQNMGLRQAKVESLCLKCHYTADRVGDEVRAVAGVTCESCHGAARDWKPIHNDYGVDQPGLTIPDMKPLETPEHRAMRIAQSEANGMLRPSSDLYAVAANCFECHTVPEEKLVNVGGHSPGSSGFELVDQIDEIQHNFLPAQWGGSNANREPAPERKRMMYVLGRALDYEYNLRGLAEATGTGPDQPYFKVMEGRVKAAQTELDIILRAADLPEIAAVVRAGRGVELRPNNRAALLAAADQMRTHAQKFARENDGTQLTALDPLIFDGNPVGGTDGLALIADVEGNSYEKRTRPAWFPTTELSVETVPACGCHNTGRDGNALNEYDWLDGDAHSGTADLLDGSGAEYIAQNYGLTPEQMKQGNQICMNCHGTAAAGQGDAVITASVSCQSCHGPASAYQNAHDPGGYAAGADLGMAQLETASVRAATCARCHLITDERLLAAGHADGSSFDFADRNGRISEHWTGPELAADALTREYEKILAARPIPDVAPATAPVAAIITPTPAPSGDGTPAAPSGTPGAPAPAATPTPSAPVVASASVVGERRSRPAWVNASISANTLTRLRRPCASCHGNRDENGRDVDEGAVYAEGPHNSASSKLFRGGQPTQQAAVLLANYGISAQQMLSAEQICMNCHGTVGSDGPAIPRVDCQGCHGGAKDYFESHQDGGYELGAPDGMTQLETASIRAETCARCHLITDERLLSAGHSSGQGFQLGQRNAAIKHWVDETASASALDQAYARVFNARPIPSVQQAELPPPPPPVARTRRRSGGGSGSAGSAGASTPDFVEPIGGSLTGFEVDDIEPARSVAVSDSTSTEDLLLLVKQRLENIYKALRRE